MKKIIFGLLLLTILLVGCGKESQELYLEPVGKTENISMVTHPNGAYGIITSDNGFYAMLNEDDCEYTNIEYTDIDSMQSTILCNRIECKHDNKTCTGVIDTFL